MQIGYNGPFYAELSPLAELPPLINLYCTEEIVKEADTRDWLPERMQLAQLHLSDPRNAHLAIPILEQIDNAAARYHLGACYFSGRGVAKNEKRAFTYIKEAARYQHIQAQACLALFYLQGVGCEPSNWKEAHKWAKKAANQNDPLGHYLLGYCAEHGKGRRKSLPFAFQCYTQSANQGNPHAQEALGVCYYKGIETPKCEKMAFFWYQQAASQHLPYSLLNVGICLCRGIGTEQNRELGMQYIQEAAKFGVEEAQIAFLIAEQTPLDPDDDFVL